MTLPAIFEKLKSLLGLDENHEAFKEARGLYQKFDQAKNYDDAKNASQNLIRHIYMESTLPLNKQKEYLQAFEMLMEEEMRKRFLMAQFVEEQKKQQEFLYEFEKKEEEVKKIFVLMTYELAAKAEAARRQKEELPTTSTSPIVPKLPTYIDITPKKIKAKMKKSIEEVFRGMDETGEVYQGPLTRESTIHYDKIQILQEEYENADSLTSASKIARELVEVLKAENEIPSFGQTPKNPEYFNDLLNYLEMAAYSKFNIEAVQKKLENIEHEDVQAMAAKIQEASQELQYAISIEEKKLDLDSLDENFLADIVELSREISRLLEEIKEVLRSENINDLSQGASTASLSQASSLSDKVAAIADKLKILLQQLLEKQELQEQSSRSTLRPEPPKPKPNKE